MKQIAPEDVLKLFPEIAEIENETLKQNTVDIWCEVFAQSNWPTLETAKFNALCPGITLVDHTRAVTQGAIALADAHKAIFGSEYDKDTLLVCSILHDVCKLLEQDPVGENGSQKNQLGKMIQHGFFSGYYAQKYGMPPKIVSILVAHTGNSRAPLRSAEGIALFYADMHDADRHRLCNDLPLHLDKIK